MQRFLLLSILGVSLWITACGSNTPSPTDPARSNSEQIPIDVSPLGADDAAEFQKIMALIDRGSLDTAEARCNELLQKHPHQFDLTFELALISRIRKQPERAVQILSPYSNTLPAQGMAALASAHDEAGNADPALDVVAAGLARDPKSGLLYSTKGVILRGKGDDKGAFEAFQEGANTDPQAPSNHLQLAVLFAGTNFGVLTLIHGEIFRNLEPFSERSEKVGALLVQTMSSGVTVEKNGNGEKSISVHLVAPEAIGGDPTHPYQIYEVALGLPLSMVAEDGFDFEELLEARRQFARVWWERSGGARLPLAGFLHELDAAGHLDAYHAWLIAPAYPNEATAWAEAHQPEIEALAHHLREHPLATYL